MNTFRLTQKKVWHAHFNAHKPPQTGHASMPRLYYPSLLGKVILSPIFAMFLYYFAQWQSKFLIFLIEMVIEIENCKTNLSKIPYNQIKSQQKLYFQNTSYAGRENCQIGEFLNFRHQANINVIR